VKVIRLELGEEPGRLFDLRKGSKNLEKEKNASAFFEWGGSSDPSRELT
jgi:hypothetical protein